MLSFSSHVLQSFRMCIECSEHCFISCASTLPRAFPVRITTADTSLGVAGSCTKWDQHCLFSSCRGHLLTRKGNRLCWRWKCIISCLSFSKHNRQHTAITNKPSRWYNRELKYFPAVFVFSKRLGKSWLSRKGLLSHGGDVRIEWFHLGQVSCAAWAPECIRGSWNDIPGRRMDLT